MKEFMEFAPFLIPLLIVELLLAITAVIHVIRHPKYKFGNMVLWIVIVLFIQILGPIVYFIFGRGEE